MATMTVLVVDDSRVSREVIKVYLTADGVELMDAANGEEALEKMRAKPPTLVIADMNMPKLDGPGLCRAVRMEERLAHIPVLILTGERGDDAQRICLEAGARAVLVKPIDPISLMTAVTRSLEG